MKNAKQIDEISIGTPEDILSEDDTQTSQPSPPPSPSMVNEERRRIREQRPLNTPVVPQGPPANPGPIINLAPDLTLDPDLELCWERTCRGAEAVLEGLISTQRARNQSSQSSNTRGTDETGSGLVDVAPGPSSRPDPSIEPPTPTPLMDLVLPNLPMPS